MNHYDSINRIIMNNTTLADSLNEYISRITKSSIEIICHKSEHILIITEHNFSAKIILTIINHRDYISLYDGKDGRLIDVWYNTHCDIDLCNEFITKLEDFLNVELNEFYL